MSKTLTATRFCVIAAAALGLATSAKGAYGIGFKPWVELGDTLGGTFSQSINLSPYSSSAWELGLVLSLRGLNTDLPVGVALLNSDLSQFVSYSAQTEGILGSDAFLPLALVLPNNSFDYSKVGGLQITWDGSGSIDVIFSHLAARAINGSSQVNLAPLWANAFLIDPDATFATYTQTPPPPPPPPGGGSFSASAPGGVLFLVGGATAELASRATNWTYAQISPGGTSWSATSDSNAKTGITAVDHREVLRGVASLPVSAWQYKHDTNSRHIGPMAQDFRQAFGLGFDDKHISTLDADGVALSALKGLIEELEERQQRSAAQAQRLTELETQLRDLQDRIGDTLPPRP